MLSEIGIIVVAPAGPRGTYKAPALAIAAARAGAIGIVDLEFVGSGEHASNSIQQLSKHARSGRIGLRSRSGNLPVQQLEDWIDERRTEEPPVMLISAGVGRFEEKVLKSDIALAKEAGFQVFVEVVSVKEAVLAEICGTDVVVAKGHESGGRVGDATAFVLVQECICNVNLPVWARGGIGLHTAAAVAAAGASGVVLDSQLYLCRDSAVPADVQLRFERLDGSETSLIQSDSLGQYRLLAANGSSRLQELERLFASGKQDEVIEFLKQNCDADHDELWIVGQDSCFAKTFALAGGTVAGCIDAIRESVAEHLQIAASSKVLDEEAPLAQSHGTRYPVVQGAMTRVSDTSDFALRVAQGGGLPFLALSMMRGAEIEKLLVETRGKLGTMPWGVGVLGFVPQQLRQEQMEVVNRHKPPFALIAGGRPDQAKALEDAGTKTYLHVPSPLLLKSFIEMGSRRFIFEGKECGGHVGPRSSFVLWESMIEVLLESIGPKDNPSSFHVLFAGGIHDDVSAAMVACMAAPLVARGIKVGVLVGTAYLFTEEAVSAGAIVPLFQEAALKCDETVLLETGPGHSIRCIDSPYKNTFDRCREELQQKSKSRDEVREELELMNLGRLRIASKGITRANGNGLEDVPADKQWHEGMYMIGQIASMHKSVLSIADLHSNICTGGQKLLSALAKQPDLEVVEQRQGEAIAIVGMSCMFPQANDVETFWQNILNKVDAIGEVPATHFKWQNFYDKDPLARDKCISKWGGFIDNVLFDPTPYGIPPSSLESIDPMQVLILESAGSALFDAGYSSRRFPREKTSVILANAGHGPITALYSLRSMLDWKLEDLDEATAETIKSNLPEWSEDSFPGYLGNVTAGRVSNRLDLKGLNFSIDAACASSLAALYVAVSDLRGGTSDVVLLGATDTHNQPGDYLSFSKTHALSPRGRCHTFDANADGIVISEGMAMVVLKRLSDAERDGDRIYAVIRGIGGSSDGRDLSLTAPRPEGQMLALERAYSDAGVSPSTVSLVEAHGTGTVAGDKAEVEALTRVFHKAGAPQSGCAIGSVKTNIGHTKAAAGLASIVKIAKALHHKVLPPSINVQSPNPACKFGEGPFYLNTESRPWLNVAETPRRAGVSAFGFGGTNFHTVLEEYVPACLVDEKPPVQAWSSELFLWKAASPEDLDKTLKQAEANIDKIISAPEVETSSTSLASRKLFEMASKLQIKFSETSTARCALAIVASNLKELKDKIGRSREQMSKQSANFSMPIGIHYSSEFGNAPKVAFLFPGQGSQRVDMLKDLSLYFPEIRKSIEESDAILKDKVGFAMSKLIYPCPALSETAKAEQQEKLTSTEMAQPALGVCDLAMLRLLQWFGVKPDMVAGHSYGEFVALHAAGVLSRQQVLQLSADRGQILADAARNNPGAMAAVSADLKTIESTIKDIKSVFVANVNTPNQCIISGATEAIDKALDVFKRKNIAGKKIPVSAAFHSPLLEESKKPLATALRNYSYASPQVAVYSNTTARPYEPQPERIIAQLGEHALKPVLFAEQLESMYSDGARIFVEVGPGNVLAGLTEATLSGKDVVVLSTERAKNPLEHFLSTVGLLTVRGAVKDIGKLFWNRMPGLEGSTYEEVVAKKRGPLLYRVNSVMIEKIDRNGQALLANKNKGKHMAAQNAGNGTGNGKREIANDKVIRETIVTATTQKALPAAGKNGTPNNNGKTPAPAPVAKPAARANGPAPSVMPAAPMQRTDSASERVMMEFQRSMMEMTNRFLETQENVMLAYLQAGGQASPVRPIANQMVAAPTAPAVAFEQSFVPALSEEIELHPVSDVAEALVDEIESTGTPINSGALDTEALIDSLYEIVSERTGYPREMLDPTLDLEADLGIDSIKRVEILNNFRKLLPEVTQEKLESGIEKLAGTKTLEGIIEWISSLDADADSGATTGSDLVLETGNVKNVGRGIVSIKALEAATTSSAEFAPLTLILSDRTELSKSIQTLLGERGQVTEILSGSNDEQVITSINAARAKHGAIGSLIYVGGSRVAQLFQIAKELEQDLREHASHGRRSALICTTTMGGTFGFGGLAPELPMETLVQQAGLVGLSKTIAKEFTGVHVKALDFETAVTPEQFARSVVSEFAADDDIVEIGFKNGQRIGLDVAEQPYPETAPEELPLTSSSVVLVTGGARGITAEIAIDLAKRHHPNFILVGRLPRPAEKESATTSGLELPKDLKAAIIEEMRAAGKIINVREVERTYQQLLREREVRTTLERLQAAGSTVRYYSVDVADENAFGRLIDSIYETSNIDGIIHGAGIIEDALIKDKSVESFERVFNTKVRSAMTLARKTRFETLKFMYLFSSVVGRTGNSGQADYVAANEAMNKLAVQLNEKSGSARIASLLWGPWQAGMAPRELEEVFASHGWSMIQPADGRTCFYEELRYNRKDQVEVLLVGKLKENSKLPAHMQRASSQAGTTREPIHPTTTPTPQGIFLHTARLQQTAPPTFAYNIDTSKHHYLHDHKFDGIPVMPMAVALEIMLEAACALYPDRHLVRVSHMDIPAGIVFHTSKKDFLVEAKPDRAGSGQVDLQLISTGAVNKTHFRCKAYFAASPNTVSQEWITPTDSRITKSIGTFSTMPSESVLPQPGDVYGKWLFHGPIFQGIKETLFLAPDGISGRVIGAAPSLCVSNPDASKWNMDPVLLDSAMQLAGIWARFYKDVTVLPTGFKSLHFFGPIPAKATAQINLATAMATELLCDLAVYDEHGQLSFVVEGLGGIASKAFNRFSAQEPVKEMAQ